MGNLCPRAGSSGRHVFTVGVLDDKEQVAGTGDLVVTSTQLQLARHSKVCFLPYVLPLVASPLCSGGLGMEA